MSTIFSRQGKFALRWCAVAAGIVFSMTLAVGCSDTDTEAIASSTPETPDAVSATHNAGTDDSGGADEGGNVLSVRPVTNSNPVDQGQTDCEAKAEQHVAAEASLETCNITGGQVYELAPAIATGNEVTSAQAHQDSYTGDPVVTLEFTSDAGQDLHAFTSENKGQALAFVVDGHVLSAPLIQGATPASAPTTLVGDFSESQAHALADRLN